VPAESLITIWVYQSRRESVHHWIVTSLAVARLVLVATLVAVIFLYSKVKARRTFAPPYWSQGRRPEQGEVPRTTQLTYTGTAGALADFITLLEQQDLIVSWDQFSDQITDGHVTVVLTLSVSDGITTVKARARMAIEQFNARYSYAGNANIVEN
jgi:hypothetical protein